MDSPITDEAAESNHSQGAMQVEMSEVKHESPLPNRDRSNENDDEDISPPAKKKIKSEEFDTLQSSPPCSSSSIYESISHSVPLNLEACNIPSPVPPLGSVSSTSNIRTLEQPPPSPSTSEDIFHRVMLLDNSSKISLLKDLV